MHCTTPPQFTPMNYYVEDYKRELITRYVLPAFGQMVSAEESKINEIVKRCRLHNAVKYQQLESPGPGWEGQLLFSIQAMIHSYYYSMDKSCRYGTNIWNKCRFIFNDSGLLDGEPRTDYIEILESSEVLSISYADLLDLMEYYPDINNAIRLLAVRQGMQYRKRNALLLQSPMERVKQFIAENQSFIYCTSQEVQAMHVNLTRVGYVRQLEKLNSLKLI